jgi:hypothetical protein
MGKLGLDRDKEADLHELDRLAFVLDWGPILELPVRSSRGGFRPAIDEAGQLDWGAFGTVDFERLHGPFDKARFKADCLQEDVRCAVIMLGLISGRMRAEQVNAVQARLRESTFDLDSLDDNDERGFARWYSRIQRLKAEIRELREFSWWRRAQVACLRG